MQNWLPYSQKPPAKPMANYNPFFSPNNARFYAVGGNVKVHQSRYSEGARELVNSNPLVKEGFIDYGPALESLQYGFGKGIRNKRPSVQVSNNGRTSKQVDLMDASNYNNFIK
jgi:hypothetical protein